MEKAVERARMITSSSDRRYQWRSILWCRRLRIGYITICEKKEISPNDSHARGGTERERVGRRHLTGTVEGDLPTTLGPEYLERSVTLVEFYVLLSTAGP